MAEHTKGPWGAQKTKGWGGDWCIHDGVRFDARPLAHILPHRDVFYQQVEKPTEDGGSVVTFTARTPEGEAAKATAYEEAQANARLIAAAPELLEALESLHGRYVACIGNEGPEALAALAALAKARGQS